MFKPTLYILLITILSANAIAQDEKVLDDFMNSRREMIKKAMKMMDSDMESDFFGKGSVFGDVNMRSNSAVKIEEKYDKDGNYVLLVSPENENTKLDIQTTDTMIKISGVQVIDTETVENGHTSRSSSRSQFSKSIAIPNGYTAKGPTQEGKKIKFVLIPTGSTKIKMKPKSRPAPKGRIPIKRGNGDQSI